MEDSEKEQITREDPLYRAIMQLVVSVEQDHPTQLTKSVAKQVRALMPGPFQIHNQY